MSTDRPFPIALVGWKLLRKGSLLGFAPVRLGLALTINGVVVHASHRRRWVSLPGEPLLDAEGRHKRDERGKGTYVPLAEWSDRDARDRFSEGVVAAIEHEFPADLEPAP